MTMNKAADPLKKIAEYILPGLVFIILSTFLFAKFFRHPYGFGWESSGKIYIVFTKQPEPTLQVGDQLMQIGPLSWEAFHADLLKTFFNGVKPGEVVPVVVARKGQVFTIPWRLPGINKNELLDQLFSEWFFSYIFWLVGTVALL